MVKYKNTIFFQISLLFFHRKSEQLLLTCLSNEETKRSKNKSDQFFCFKETLKMPHLPGTHGYKDYQLCYRPPEDSLIGTFRSLSESFFSIL